MPSRTAFLVCGPKPPPAEPSSMLSQRSVSYLEVTWTLKLTWLQTILSILVINRYLSLLGNPLCPAMLQNYSDADYRAYRWFQEWKVRKLITVNVTFRNIHIELSAIKVTTFWSHFLPTDWRLSACWQSYNFWTRDELIKVNDSRLCNCTKRFRPAVSHQPRPSPHQNAPERWKGSDRLKDFLASRRSKARLLQLIQLRIFETFTVPCRAMTSTARPKKATTAKWKTITREPTAKAIGSSWIKIFKRISSEKSILASDWQPEIGGRLR